MLLFKKIVTPMLFPVTISLVALAAGLVLLWLNSRQRLGKALVTAGAIMLGFFSFKPTSEMLLKPLENRYPAYDCRPSGATAAPRPGYVVVLSGGSVADPRLPVTSRINSSCLARLIEGIRIYRENPGSKLVVTGGALFDRVPTSKVMADVAREMGVKEEDIISESESKDTDDQARILADIVGDREFILVTEASHMPRAMALFRKQGMNPIPAPTRHMVRRGHEWNPASFFPSATNLLKSEKAFYEYLALIWDKLRGHL